MQTVVIGTGVTKFGEKVFDQCNNLKNIYYRGTEAQWAQIQYTHRVDGQSQTDMNPQFEGVTVWFYAETQPTEPGNYWRYVDGVPTPWKTEE